MAIPTYIFKYKEQPTILQSGDIARVDIVGKTIVFIRKSVHIFLKFGSDVIHDDDIDTNNASKIIQNISKLTPFLDTNSNSDILVFELKGSKENNN